MKSFYLEKDARYRATIKLAGFFESLDSNADLQSRFESAGFCSVTVWGSGHDRFAEGVWPNDSQNVEFTEEMSNHIVSVIRVV